MHYTNTLPVVLVKQIDHEALFNPLVKHEGEFHQVSLTTSLINSFSVWLKRNQPGHKLVTRQMTVKHQLHHTEPLPYCITLVKRTK